jgi:hypothetical protein
LNFKLMLARDAVDASPDGYAALLTVTKVIERPADNKIIHLQLPWRAFAAHGRSATANSLPRQFHLL